MFYAFVKIVFKFVFLVLFRIKTVGKDRVIEGGTILAVNHKSNWDPLAIWATCPRQLEYIAKSVLIILGLVNPFGDSFFELKGIWYIIGEGVYLFILLYFIWIIYCFRHHLK